MSNASLKEQLQAMASKLSDNGQRKPIHKKFNKANEQIKKDKPKWLIEVQYGIELLKVYFPQAFNSANGIQPLKKGIKEDLLKRLSGMSNIVTEDKACMVKSLAYYVNLKTYHKSVIEGAVRIDLDGNAMGLVSAEEAKYSLEKQQAKVQPKQEQKTDIVS